MNRRDRGRGKHGDFLRVDDRSGFIHWASETQKEWNGAIVHRSLWEARHPQDFVRGRRDDLAVYDPRTVADPAFLPGAGALTTTIAAVVGNPADNNHVAFFGALGQFAVGQGDDGDNDIAPNLAGSRDLVVTSTAGMSPSDRVGVFLDSGSLFQTTIVYVVDSGTIQIATPLPYSVSAGNMVTDYSAVTTPSLASVF